MRDFLRRAVGWLGRQGMRVTRVMTDNGSAFRSRVFGTNCRGLGRLLLSRLVADDNLVSLHT